MADLKTKAQFHFTGVKKYFIALMVLSFKLIFKNSPAVKAT
ncbi:ATP synthase membrane subunit K, mitochondrial-like [Hippopotamus amphibius kiboko]|nr:ATP synthase membrane subunit K, mitochondrial-like [Hippopotamus amphibius kiboko]